MKMISYKLNAGTDELPNLVPARMTYSEANLEIVKKEAHNGEYTVVDSDDTEE